MTTPSRRPPRARAIEYPSSDGKPMAETQTHAQVAIDLIETLGDHFAAEPDVYIWGNLLLFYEEGSPRKHVAPDVLFARGVPKEPPRDHYLVWKEGKGPDLVTEVTSKTTRAEDQKKKLVLYRDVLKVPEFFLFDPFEDYLKPPMQGYRLEQGEYVAIAPVEGRLPSAVLGLHFERDGTALRLFDPAAGRRLLTRLERIARANDERQRIEAETERLRWETETLRRHAELSSRAQIAEAETEHLRRELEDLRRRLTEGA